MSNSKSEDTHFKTQVLGNTAVSYRLLKNGHLLLITVDEATGKWEADEVAGVDPKNPIESIEDTPPEPPQDTSLDLRQQFRTILEDTIYDVTALGSDTTAGQMKLISLFAEQQAKLLQVIEDEVDKCEIDDHTVQTIFKHEVLLAIKKLKDNVINGGSL